jgi:hypothetical protein
MRIRIEVWTLAILTIILPASVTGQNVNEKIRLIKSRFTSINQTSDYQVVSLSHEDFLENMTDGGGQLQGYFRKDEIQKIFESVGLSYCMQTKEYYFWDNKLIFVYEKEVSFKMDSLGTLDHSKVGPVFEGRYYFSDDKLISTQTKGRKLMDDSVALDSQTKEVQLLERARERIKLLISKRR